MKGRIGGEDVKVSVGQMIDFLTNWVLHIATVVILLVFIEILVPLGKTKKIVNLISGFILLITIIQPFIKLLSEDYSFNQFEQIDNINGNSSNTAGGDTSIGIDTGGLRKEQVDQIIKVYKKKVENRISEIVGETEGLNNIETDIIINEDFNSPEFGKIKRIYVYIEENYIKPGKIDEVKISIGEGDSAADNGDIDEHKNNYIILLEEKLTNIFIIKREDVVVSFK